MASRKPKAMRMNIEVVGLRDMLKRIGRLDKVAQNEIRDAARRIADTEAGRIRARAGRAGRQAMLAAESVRTRRDRVPVIVAGGSKRLPGQRRTYGDLFFGAEFGGGNRPRTRQFQPHRGTEGYWFWPQLRDDQDDIFREWASVVDAVEQAWSK